jgi:hypothetical protein
VDAPQVFLERLEPVMLVIVALALKAVKGDPVQKIKL